LLTIGAFIGYDCYAWHQYYYVELFVRGNKEKATVTMYVVTFCMYLISNNLVRWLFSLKYWTISIELPQKGQTFMVESYWRSD